MGTPPPAVAMRQAWRQRHSNDIARRYACRISAPSTTTPWLARRPTLASPMALATAIALLAASTVLVVHRDVAMVKRAGLVVDLWGAPDIGPHRSPSRVVVDRHRDIVTGTV